MTARELLKRTPLRLAASFAALFATTVLALFLILYLSISARLENQIRNRVLETMDTLTSVDEDKKFDELVSVVTHESASVRVADSIFELVDDAGIHLAGNVRNIPASADWVILNRAGIAVNSDKGDPGDHFHAIWAPVSKGRLLVGSSDHELRQTQVLLLEVLGWALAMTMAAVGLLGAYLARQAQHRIDAFATTLSAVSRGQITARVPMLGADDDIDHVGAQINRTLSHLQRLIENVNQSSSDIAHDLKRPIGRLRQRLDRARRGAKDVAAFRSTIDDTLLELDSIIETFDALLRIAQIEAGARRSRFDDLDLNSVLSDVADVYGAVAEDAQDTLVCDIPPSSAAIVRGDRELLVQLFANLVENAIRHCPAGTHIRLTLGETPTTFDAAVSDNGPGIPEAERAQVFRRLYRLERARSTPGSGLGLSLVAAIAELHEARIELSGNAPGLKVTVSIPKTTA